jgi:adenylate cyclase
MDMTPASTSVILLDKVSDWLMQTAIRGADLESVVNGFCERLAAAGVPLARIHLTFSMLHPLYRAMGFTWRRGTGVTSEGYRHAASEGASDRFLKSPYYYLLNNNLDHVRRRIIPDEAPEFPILEDLQKEGMTDYLAFAAGFGDDSSQGMMGSWATAREGGFTDSDIGALLRIQNNLALAARMAVLGKLAGNMLSTYLGGGAGARVLRGQIKRGDGETIRAALVMADMRRSTELAERSGRQEYIAILNEFFDALAGPFAEAGGEILSFLGDGFLAVFPCPRQKAPTEIACRSALASARIAVARMSAFNASRRQTGAPEIGYGIGLHIGNVMFGNVGLKDRLTFSVFGPAVNTVQRLQTMTKKYSKPIVASSSFADYCGGDWSRLGHEKLRGVDEAMTVMTPSLVDYPVSERRPLPIDTGLSDAEQVILLHRDTHRPDERKGI